MLSEVGVDFLTEETFDFIYCSFCFPIPVGIIRATCEVVESKSFSKPLAIFGCKIIVSRFQISPVLGFRVLLKYYRLAMTDDFFSVEFFRDV